VFFAILPSVCSGVYASAGICDSVSIASADADSAAAAGGGDITEQLSPSHPVTAPVSSSSSSQSVAVVKPCVSTSAVAVSLLIEAHDDRSTS